MQAGNEADVHKLPGGLQSSSSLTPLRSGAERSGAERSAASISSFCSFPVFPVFVAVTDAALPLLLPLPLPLMAPGFSQRSRLLLT